MTYLFWCGAPVLAWHNRKLFLNHVAELAVAIEECLLERMCFGCSCRRRCVACRRGHFRAIQINITLRVILSVFVQAVMLPPFAFHLNIYMSGYSRGHLAVLQSDYSQDTAGVLEAEYYIIRRVAPALARGNRVLPRMMRAPIFVALPRQPLFNERHLAIIIGRRLSWWRLGGCRWDFRWRIIGDIDFCFWHGFSQNTERKLITCERDAIKSLGDIKKTHHEKTRG